MSKISRWVVGVEDPIAVRKRVVFRPATAADTVKVGHAVCYNSDISADVEERTSNPASAHVGSDGNETTYAEGVQSYTGRMLIVEQPASGNLADFAGIVAALGPENGADGDTIEIYVPNGAMVPVWTNASCTRGTTVLGPASSSYIMQADTGDGDPFGCAVAQETVDRSSTNGLVWAKVSKPGQTGFNLFLTPKRSGVTSYMRGVKIDGTEMLTGTAASKSYVLDVSGDRETAAATGDSNDAIVKVSGSNYGACDTNFVFAGLNAVINNRDGGTLGRLTNTISVSLKQGSTTAYAYGLQVDAQDLAATAKTEFGGLDIAINREGLAATTEFGMQLRTRGTINTAINTAIRITKDATDHGFVNLFNIETDAVDVIAASGDITFTSSDKLIPIVFNGTTYYLVATDNV